MIQRFSEFPILGIRYSNIIPFPLYDKDKKIESNIQLKVISLEDRLITKPVYIFENPIINRDKIRKCIKGYSGIYYKYGINSFNLVILEILGESHNTSRIIKLTKEDYYLSNYLPEYNILDKGSSSLNYKHSIEARAKIRDYALKRDKKSIVYSPEFLSKQKSSSKLGVINRMYGKNEQKKDVKK
jgi:hypothetical protein